MVVDTSDGSVVGVSGDAADDAAAANKLSIGIVFQVGSQSTAAITATRHTRGARVAICFLNGKKSGRVSWKKKILVPIFFVLALDNHLERKKLRFSEKKHSTSFSFFVIIFLVIRRHTTDDNHPHRKSCLSANARTRIRISKTTHRHPWLWRGLICQQRS
jgi:hypothetical protein